MLQTVKSCTLGWFLNINNMDALLFNSQLDSLVSCLLQNKHTIVSKGPGFPYA